MAWDINQVVLIGRLTKDPELRYSQNGFAICPLSIAVNRRVPKEGAEEEVSYFDVTTFGKTAEVCNQYLSKGKQIGLQGYLRQRRWEDQNGQKHYKVEIVADRIQFLGSPSGSSSGNTGYSPSNKENTAKVNNQPAGQDFDTPFPEDDDIPF